MLKSVTLTLVTAPDFMPDENFDLIEMSAVGNFLHGRTQPFPQDLGRLSSWDVAPRLDIALPPVDHVVQSGAKLAEDAGRVIASTIENLSGTKPALWSKPEIVHHQHEFPDETAQAIFGTLQRKNAQHAVIIADPNSINAVVRRILPETMHSFPRRMDDKQTATFQAADWQEMSRGRAQVIGHIFEASSLNHEQLGLLKEEAQRAMGSDSTLNLNNWLAPLPERVRERGQEQVRAGLSLTKMVTGALEIPRLERRRDIPF